MRVTSDSVKKTLSSLINNLAIKTEEDKITWEYTGEYYTIPLLEGKSLELNIFYQEDDYSEEEGKNYLLCFVNDKDIRYDYYHCYSTDELFSSFSLLEQKIQAQEEKNLIKLCNNFIERK